MTNVDSAVGAATAEAERLRSAAVVAARRAWEARELAAAIARRRMALLTRDDDALVRHTNEVWRSRAAAQSRVRLQRGVGFALWTVAEGLREIELALEREAATLEREASSGRRRADVLAHEITALRWSAPSVADAAGQAATFSTSNPVPLGNR